MNLHLKDCYISQTRSSRNYNKNGYLNKKYQNQAM